MPNRVRIATTTVGLAAAAVVISLVATPTRGAAPSPAPPGMPAVPRNIDSVGRLHELLSYVTTNSEIDAYLTSLADRANWFDAVNWYAGVEQQLEQAAAWAATVQPSEAVSTSSSTSSSSSNAAHVSQASSGSGTWERVAQCEEGGNNDPTYGYFGITPSSWAAYGGAQYAPTAGGASQSEQIAVANAISGGQVPDANGCGSW